jgi:hypothetical protein
MDFLLGPLAIAALLGGVGGLIFLHKKKTPALRALRSMLIAVAVCGLLLLCMDSSRIIWDGGYPTAEFQIQFVGVDGEGVPGITLRVEDSNG